MNLSDRATKLESSSDFILTNVMHWNIESIGRAQDKRDADRYRQNARELQQVLDLRYAELRQLNGNSG